MTSNWREEYDAWYATLEWRDKRDDVKMRKLSEMLDEMQNRLERMRTKAVMWRAVSNALDASMNGVVAYPPGQSKEAHQAYLDAQASDAEGEYPEEPHDKG